MAISVQELIANKEKIEKSKKDLYDLETSIGTVTVKQPSLALITEVMGLEKNTTDKYLILQTVVEPNLKNKELQRAYGCTEPLDIVEKLFKPGEVYALSKKIIECAGYGANIEAKVHEKLKN